MTGILNKMNVTIKLTNLTLANLDVTIPIILSAGETRTITIDAQPYAFNVETSSPRDLRIDIER